MTLLLASSSMLCVCFGFPFIRDALANPRRAGVVDRLFDLFIGVSLWCTGGMGFGVVDGVMR